MTRTAGATDRSIRRSSEAVVRQAKGTTNLIKLNFTNSPVIYDFMMDESFVRGICGPIGSGKTFGCCGEIMRRAAMQEPDPEDNIRYTRWAIIRNTGPELRTTTIKTWQEMYPEDKFGQMRWSPPITHHIKIKPNKATGEPGIDCEVIFLALDEPKDVRKLLSLELTGAFVNEAREIPKAVIDGLTGRVGRYPSKKKGGPTWRGIIMDTNPMDADHWWVELADSKSITKGRFPWKFWRQPGGVVEVKPEHANDNDIQAAGKFWRINDRAENLDNLVDGYYEQTLMGKDLDWILCYAAGQYVFVRDGKAVWPEFSQDVMVMPCPYDDTLPIHIGMDFGLTPAAVFGQKNSHGRWMIVDELVSEEMGLERFGEQLTAHLDSQYPNAEVRVWGDPAGNSRDPIFEHTAFKHLASIGLHANPTDTNDFGTRREAGAAPMNRMIFGKPGLLVDPKCLMVKKALAGGYHFKRVKMAGGQERYMDKPNKDQYSHVGDAYGYLMLGGGEYGTLTRAKSKRRGPGTIRAKIGFNPFKRRA